MPKFSNPLKNIYFNYIKKQNPYSLGAVEELILWENLEIMRYEVRNSNTGEKDVMFLTKAEEENPNVFRDSETGVELEVTDKETLVEWMANNYKQYGCVLEFVTDRSGEGVQFVKGFGGIGGILRWKVDFIEMAQFEEAAVLDAADSSDDDSDNSSDGYGFDDGDFGF